MTKAVSPTIADCVLSGVLLVLCAVSVLFLHSRRSSAPAQALIYHNSTLLRREYLDRDRMLRLDHLQVEIKGGRLRIAASDCPRGLCRHAGWIVRPGQVIACVPNKIVIEIKGTNNNKAECDVISY